MPSGQNDQCWDDTSTCYTWRYYNTYACGGDSVSGNPLILYHCNYGALSVSRTCPNRCVTWPGHDDYCQ